MALTQTQIIQSMAEALSWFEKELSRGVTPAELNHLTGRIGELYAAMITRGQMALESKQRGYDVIVGSLLSASGQGGFRFPGLVADPILFDRPQRPRTELLDASNCILIQLGCHV